MAFQGFGPLDLMGINPQDQIRAAAERQMAELNALGLGGPELMQPTTAPNPLNIWSGLGAVLQGPAAAQELGQRSTSVEQQNAQLRQRAEFANQQSKIRTKERLDDIKAKIAEIKARRDQTLADMGFRSAESEKTRGFQAGEAEKARTYDATNREDEQAHAMDLRDKEHQNRLAMEKERQRTANITNFLNSQKKPDQRDRDFDENYAREFMNLLDNVANGVVVDPQTMLDQETGLPLANAEYMPMSRAQMERVISQAHMVASVTNLSEERRQVLLEQIEDAVSKYEANLARFTSSAQSPGAAPKDQGGMTPGQRWVAPLVQFGQGIADMFGSSQDVKLIDDIAGSFVEAESGNEMFGPRNVDIFNRAFKQ